MGKRQTMILLAIVVVSVWGMVAVRIWRWLRREDVPVSVKKEIAITETHQGDTLLLDYRDPFLSIRPAGFPSRTIQGREHRKMTPMPTIGYKGTIRGADGKEKALIEYQGKIEALPAGSSVEGVLIVGISPESLTVQWEDRMQTIDVK